jgi:glycosyltransferase involved in cell wall biosynthesis
MKTKPTINFIDRYDNALVKRKYSGYEQLPLYMEGYKRLHSINWLNKLLKLLLIGKQPKDYIWANSSKEVVAIFMALVFNRPVHYLYGDKDTFIILQVKRIFRWKRIRIYATLHWPLIDSDRNRIAQLAFIDCCIVMGSQFHQEVKKIIDNTFLVPHGIDLSFWQLEKVIEDEDYILILGTSNRDHKLQRLVAEQIIKNHGCRVKVLTHAKEERQKYSEIGVEVIEGFMGDIDLKVLITKAKALLLIQLNCIASNVVLESMALGKPLIANRVGDIVDYLGEEYPYLPFEEDINDFLTSFFKKQSLLELSQQLKNRVRDFSWYSVAKRTKAAFQIG